MNSVSSYNVVGLCALLVCTLSSCADQERNQAISKPHKETVWLGKDGGFTELFSAGAFICGNTINSDGVEGIEVVKWCDDRLVKVKDASFSSRHCMAWTSNKNYVARVEPPKGRNWWVAAFDADSDELLWQQQPPECFYIDLFGTSANGKYVCLKMSHDPVDCERGEDYADRKTTLLALVPPNKEKYDVIAKLTGSHGGADCIRTMVPSNDGKYILLCGWENTGIALIDTKSGKQLWINQPKMAVHPGEGVFSADGTRVYVGGGAGAVYVLDSKTGKELSRWWANDTGKMEYGHRISCIATSPDGRFVAAGTGPEGFVYLWDSQTGKVVRRFDHSLTTIQMLSFSPDFKYLASMAGGVVKIWELPTANLDAE